MSDRLDFFLKRIKRIAKAECPDGSYFDVYRVQERPFIVKVEDPDTQRYILFDFRETLTDDDIRKRVGFINKKTKEKSDE